MWFPGDHPSGFSNDISGSRVSESEVYSSLVSINLQLPSTLKMEAEGFTEGNYLPNYTASHSRRSMFCTF
jgi:hypothetical protein